MGVYIGKKPFNKVVEQTSSRYLVIDGECREVAENISIGFEHGEPHQDIEQLDNIVGKQEG